MSAAAQILCGYFDRPDAPAKGSPVGKLIVRMLEKCPEMSFEQARTEAASLLEGKGGTSRIRHGFAEWKRRRNRADFARNASANATSVEVRATGETASVEQAVQ
jgi:hypothetical protein